MKYTKIQYLSQYALLIIDYDFSVFNDFVFRSVWFSGQIHKWVCWLMAPAGYPAGASRCTSSWASVLSPSTPWSPTPRWQRSVLMRRWTKCSSSAAASPPVTVPRLKQARWEEADLRNTFSLSSPLMRAPGCVKNLSSQIYLQTQALILS